MYTFVHKTEQNLISSDKSHLNHYFSDLVFTFHIFMRKSLEFVYLSDSKPECRNEINLYLISNAKSLLRRFTADIHFLSPPPLSSAGSLAICLQHLELACCYEMILIHQWICCCSTQSHYLFVLKTNRVGNRSFKTLWSQHLFYRYV